MRKYYFTNRTLNIWWNSLPNHIVLSDTVNTLDLNLINSGNIL